MKYQETNERRLKLNIEYIDERWDQLSNLSLDLINNGIKYLFSINAGAAVAILAFIGSSEAVRVLKWPWYSLTLFILGLVLVGIINFVRFHLVEFIYKHWRADVLKYYDNNICFDEIIENDNQRSYKFSWLFLIAYFSFFCFLGGTALIAVNVNSFIKKEQQMNQNKTSTIDQKNHIPKSPPPAPIKKK